MRYPLSRKCPERKVGIEILRRVPTHLLVNRAEFERLKSYPYSSFNEQGQRNWDRLRSDLLKPLYHDRACDVYAL